MLWPPKLANARWGAVACMAVHAVNAGPPPRFVEKPQKLERIMRLAAALVVTGVIGASAVRAVEIRFQSRQAALPARPGRSYRLPYAMATHS